MSGLPLRRGGAGDRALNYAVVASLVFHGSLLFLLSLDQRAKRERSAPGPIVARLVAAPPAEPRAPAVTPQPESPKPRVADRPPIPKPLAKPAIRPAPVPKRGPIPVPPGEQAPAPAPSPSAPARPQPSSPATTESPATIPSAPSATAPTSEPPAKAAPPSVEAGALEKYRSDLIGMARRYKRYPRVALDNNWEGRVVVHMVVGANGVIASLRVTTRSGHDVLDRQAVDMIRKAKPLVPIPPAMRGREFSVEIPVIYDLKDQESG